VEQDRALHCGTADGALWSTDGAAMEHWSNNGALGAAMELLQVVEWSSGVE
jgi:hypothetical protein